MPGRQVGATQKKGIRGSVCVIGTFYSSGHYTLTFPGAGQCIELCFCGKYAPSKRCDCLALWGAAMGTGSDSSSTKAASGARTQETALSRSACLVPLCGRGGQHPSLAARSLSAQPGMHML